MRFARSLSILSLACGAVATGVLLPLYIYPSTLFNDGAANWRPLFSAIATPTNTAPWIVVLNVDSGPGGSRAPGNSDVNYINGTAQLNAFGHVTSVGYVHLLNGNASVASVEANLTAWASWSTFTAENISMQGIFFDEAIEASGISDGSNFDYLSGLITFARDAFAPKPITVVCNFGAKPADEYYQICDVIIAFESALNSGGFPPYQNLTTIQTNIPLASRRPASGIIINEFQGTAANGSPANEATLQSFIDTLKSSDVGWSYFCTEGYADGLTLPPANLSNVAAFMA
jgi:hypothetical protein